MQNKYWYGMAFAFSPMMLAAPLFDPEPRAYSLYAIGEFAFCILGFVVIVREFYLQKAANTALFVLLNVMMADIICAYAVVYRVFGLINELGIESSGRDYLYFSLVTWTTLGYGDLTPNDQGRLVAASEAFVGYIFMAVMIAALTRLLDRSAQN